MRVFLFLALLIAGCHQNYGPSESARELKFVEHSFVRDGKSFTVLCYHFDDNHDISCVKIEEK